jgi:TRAP-type mannitol/chloroaromatic compound transport system substrate-binding protein
MISLDSGFFLASSSSNLSLAARSATIDALEWVGPSLDLRMGFHKIAPYYYTGWHEPGSELQFLINLKKYNTLPKDNNRV